MSHCKNDNNPGFGNNLFEKYQENKAKFLGAIDKAKQAEAAEAQGPLGKLSSKIMGHLLEQKGIAPANEVDKDIVKQ